MRYLSRVTRGRTLPARSRAPDGAFVLFGRRKLTGFSGTVGYVTSNRAPAPTHAVDIAVAMEFVAGIAIGLGFYTRLLAISLGSAVIDHHYGTMKGMEQYRNMINFTCRIELTRAFRLGDGSTAESCRRGCVRLNGGMGSGV
ncbi:DoxX family protein [Paraburkholderia sediminicola]|uniref:DoxX family protein n=1 Tax=Paraburkholderia sediminicola TaxID=458836 RepID=UPI0038B9B405